MTSRRHNQTDSESGKEATRLTPKRCRSRFFFGSVGYSGNELVIRQCRSQLKSDAIRNESKSTHLGVVGIGFDRYFCHRFFKKNYLSVKKPKVDVSLI